MACETATKASVRASHTALKQAERAESVQPGAVILDAHAFKRQERVVPAFTERKQRMSNQSEHENPQSETVTPQELRQLLQAEVEARQQIIAQLSDEELTEIVGGVIGRVYEPPKITWQPKTSVAESAPVHNPQPATPAPSTATPAVSRTSSASGSPHQPGGWRQALSRWIIGCLTCS